MPIQETVAIRRQNYGAPTYSVGNFNTYNTSGSWSKRNVPAAEAGDSFSGQTNPADTAATEVVVSFAGPVVAGDSVSLNWVELDSDGPNFNRGAVYEFKTDMSPENAARLFAQFISGNPGTIAQAFGRDIIMRPTGAADELQVAAPVIPAP